MSAETRAFIERVLREFREIVVGLEDENNQLNSNLRNLAIRTNKLLPHQHQYQHHHQDQHHLRQSIRQHQQVSESTLSSSTSLTTSNNTNSQNTEPLSTATVSTQTQTTESVSTGTTTSTKPPPYKQAVRIIAPPQPPARTRRRNSSTLPQQYYSSSSVLTENRSSSAFTDNNMAAGSRGALIVLEGLDRVGKSTLAKRLVEHFQRIERPVAYCRFPERSTSIGRLIDSFLKDNSAKVDDHVLHLLFSANRWESSNKIRQAILSGTTMVVDRYSYSGIAYSSAKSALPIEWCRDTERGLPKPDLVIYLELPQETQAGRSGYGEERFETTDFQESVRCQYQHVMDMSQETWLKIDVDNKSPDQILGEIILPIKRCLDTCQSKPLGQLEFL